MKTDMLSTRIDHEMKLEFMHVCDDIGLSTSQAIKIFARAVINHGGIPFELKRKQPNKITLQSMSELEAGNGHRAKSTSDLFSQFGIDVTDA